MSAAALVCVSLALVMVPAPTARRRLSRVLFRTDSPRTIAAPRLALRIGSIVAASAVLVTLGPGPFLTAVMVAATTGLRVRSGIRARRRTVERSHLLEALEAVIAELRVGSHPGVAAAIVATDTHGDPARAFAVGAARSRLGGSVAEGLLRPDSSVATELARVAGAWKVAERHGLALAELLAAARIDLAGRIRLHNRATAALAGARATGTVLACLPCVGIALGHLMGAAPLYVLFGSAVGTVLLPLGAGLACAGLLWTDAITRKASI
ncbi:type II secretion system F family protein [Nocardia sp. CNY236]|uniref:type II secretion system F family protein n=1 Tax=Nocardia sp. CNY236 TaxID=1169152 RepID=UPI0003F97086|nr:hypothetical protein [Nocardia sp. CNY236]